MTTLAQIADRAQLTLNDAGAGTWPQATVESWIIDAIGDYSQRFPRTRTVTTTFSGSDLGHEFDHTTDAIAIDLVEFPAEQDPPVYLKRRPRTHPQFYGYEGYYDCLIPNDGYNYSTIWLSEEPVDGEKLIVTYTAHHDVTLVSGDDITVPRHHEALLILYVLWQAFKERLSTQEQDPDTSLAGNVTFLQQLVKGAKQAEDEYRRALERAEESRSESAVSGPWTVDDHDRIY